MNDLFSQEGRTALVTGGSRGLGREMAQALAEAGAEVVIGSRNEEEIGAAAGEIAAATGRRAVGCRLDVTERASVDAFIETAMKEFGRIDVLVNNAGMNIRAPLAEITDEDFDLIQRTNVRGVFYCCRAAVPHMVAAGYGRIVNIGSTVSLVGLAGRVSYTASKGAVLQMTRTLAVELARTGVTVNVVCPGPFATAMNQPLMENPEMAADVIGRVPMRRRGEMKEIRAPVLFLAAPTASYVTGAIVSVDGGWVAE